MKYFKKIFSIFISESILTISDTKYTVPRKSYMKSLFWYRYFENMSTLALLCNDCFLITIILQLKSII